MGTKVVYNRCFGGFSLSKEACEALAAVGVESAAKHLQDFATPSNRNGWLDYQPDIPRHDPRLVAVVEALGERANGEMAFLIMKEVDGPYRILECDGAEAVEPQSAYKWITP